MYRKESNVSDNIVSKWTAVGLVQWDELSLNQLE